MLTMWDVLYNNYVLFLMILARMMGMVLFNPFFGRKDMPVILKTGFAFFISVLLTGVLSATQTVAVGSVLSFLLLCGKELFIGFLVGFIMQLFLSVLLMAGEMIDLQLGVGMAKLYDPQSNISMPITGSLFNLFYVLCFFAANGHLTFCKILFYSFDILPLGTQLINLECGQFVTLLLANVFVLALKLALPIVAIEIISELGLGVLMRTVPQINVFMVGLQLKLLIGLILLVFIFPSFFGFFDSMTNTMLQSVQNGLQAMR